LYDNGDTLTEPSREDVVAFESSRKRLYMEQVFLPHEFLVSFSSPIVTDMVRLSQLLYIT